MSKIVNCITINTDASFSHKHNIGTYAFYIICDTFKIQKGGIFKSKVKSPMEAEMMCMANALHTCLQQPELPKTKIIVLNSDCLFAFHNIGKGSTKSEVGRKVAQIRSKLRKATAIYPSLPIFEFRHVKVHNGAPDARSHVNEWCDREAKRWMGIALSKIETV
jgi:ribonuclease HI